MVLCQTLYPNFSGIKKLGQKRRNEILLHGHINDKREGTNKQFPQTEWVSNKNSGQSHQVQNKQMKGWGSGLHVESWVTSWWNRESKFSLQWIFSKFLTQLSEIETCELKSWCSAQYKPYYSETLLSWKWWQIKLL